MKIQLIFAFVMLVTGLAHADVIVTDPAQEIEKGKPADESPDASPSSPPLETDDPGTPGPNGIELNLIGTFDSYQTGNSRTGGVDLNFGVGERGQIRVQQNYAEDRVDGQRPFKHNDDTSAGFKYRFYDDKVFKFALYPSYQFDDETARYDLDGTKEDTGGQSLYLPIIAAQQIGRVVVVENAGYGMNFDHHQRFDVFTSMAVGWAVSDTSRLEGEVASSRSEEGRTTNLRVGFVQEIFPDEKSRFETAVFASIGHSLGATQDGLKHTMYLVGITLARRATVAK